MIVEWQIPKDVLQLGAPCEFIIPGLKWVSVAGTPLYISHTVPIVLNKEVEPVATYVPAYDAIVLYAWNFMHNTTTFFINMLSDFLIEEPSNLARIVKLLPRAVEFSVIRALVHENLHRALCHIVNELHISEEWDEETQKAYHTGEEAIVSSIVDELVSIEEFERQVRDHLRSSAP